MASFHGRLYLAGSGELHIAPPTFRADCKLMVCSTKRQKAPDSAFSAQNCILCCTIRYVLVCIFCQRWRNRQQPTAVTQSLSQRVICKSKTSDANWDKWPRLESDARGRSSFPPIQAHNLRLEISLHRGLIPSCVATDHSGQTHPPAVREGGWRQVPESLTNQAEGRH